LVNKWEAKIAQTSLNFRKKNFQIFNVNIWKWQRKVGAYNFKKKLKFYY